MLKKVVVYIALLCIGSGLGWGIADYLRKTDHDKILGIIQDFPSASSGVYAVKKLPAEGACSGRTYTFYSKGFEVAEMKRMVYDEFSITTSVPTTIELNRNCEYVRNTSEELCTSLLGAYLTIPVKSQFSDITGKETYMPVSGERNDELFGRIIDLKAQESDYYIVGQMPIYNSSTSAEEYDDTPPSPYRYKGQLGVGTIEAQYRKYHLVENKDKVSTLFIGSIATGGLLGLIIAFVIFRFWTKGKPKNSNITSV